METRICKNCNKLFEVNAAYPNNLYCKLCYGELKNGAKAVPFIEGNAAKLDRTDVIVKQVCLKSAVQILPKRTPPEKVMEYTEKLMELFYRNI